MPTNFISRVISRYNIYISRQHRLEKELKSLLWKIDYNEICFERKRNSVTSTASCGLVSSVGAVVYSDTVHECSVRTDGYKDRQTYSNKHVDKNRKRQTKQKMAVEIQTFRRKVKAEIAKSTHTHTHTHAYTRNICVYQVMYNSNHLKVATIDDIHEEVAGEGICYQSLYEMVEQRIN